MRGVEIRRLVLQWWKGAAGYSPAPCFWERADGGVKDQRTVGRKEIGFESIQQGLVV